MQILQIQHNAHDVFKFDQLTTQDNPDLDVELSERDVFTALCTSRRCSMGGSIRGADDTARHAVSLPCTDDTSARQRSYRSSCYWIVICVRMCISPGASYHDSFFFFQAEDGIRDVAVTGVQTCALPI